MLDLKSLVLYNQNLNKNIEDIFCDKESIDLLFGLNNQVITFDGYGTMDGYGYRMFSNIRLYDKYGNLYKMSKNCPVYNQSSGIDHFVLTGNAAEMVLREGVTYGTKNVFDNYKCKDTEFKITVSSNYDKFIYMFTDGLSTVYTKNFRGFDMNAKHDFECVITLTDCRLITQFGFNNFGAYNSTTFNKCFKNIKLTNTINGVTKETITQNVQPRVSYTIDI